MLGAAKGSLCRDKNKQRSWAQNSLSFMYWSRSSSERSPRLSANLEKSIVGVRSIFPASLSIYGPMFPGHASRICWRDNAVPDCKRINKSRISSSCDTPVITKTSNLRFVIWSCNAASNSVKRRFPQGADEERKLFGSLNFLSSGFNSWYLSLKKSANARMRCCPSTTS